MIGGEDKFVCVDGPEFDGSLVDWDELIKRSNYYKDQEAEDRGSRLPLDRRCSLP